MDHDCITINILVSLLVHPRLLVRPLYSRSVVVDVPEARGLGPLVTSLGPYGFQVLLGVFIVVFVNCYASWYS
jgi:hypothetical protein